MSLSEISGSPDVLSSSSISISLTAEIQVILSIVLVASQNSTDVQPLRPDRVARACPSTDRDDGT
jgi:hypothetical protein